MGRAQGLCALTQVYVYVCVCVLCVKEEADVRVDGRCSTSQWFSLLKPAIPRAGGAELQAVPKERTIIFLIIGLGALPTVIMGRQALRPTAKSNPIKGDWGAKACAQGHQDLEPMALGTPSPPPLSRGCACAPCTGITSIVQQLPPVDFVLHHIGPVEGALAEVEVQGNGVAQSRHQDTVVSFVQVDAADLMAVGKDDEWLEGVWGEKVGDGVRGWLPPGAPEPGN